MRAKKRKRELLHSFGQIKSEDFFFERINKYHHNKKNNDDVQLLSEKTCHDLDIDDLFTFLDRTCSKVGQQYLYNKLRCIPKKINNREQEEKIINRFISDQNFRLDVQLLLEKLKKSDVYYISSLFQSEHIEAPKWITIVRLLSFTNLLSLLLVPFNPPLAFIILIVFIINIIFHFWNKRNLYQYLGSIPQLLHLRKIATKLYEKNELQIISPDLKKDLKVLHQLRSRMSFFRLEANLQNEMQAVFWGIFEIIKIFFLLEPLLLFGILKRLNSKQQEIENVFCFVGQVDSFQSIASLRYGLKQFCIPNHSTHEIKAENIYHPLIQNCIPNDIHLQNRSILLTGSNMSGKTSFIRSVGINVITGLTLNTCFASNMSFPRMNVYSAIRISDDLLNDKSYYFEEVISIKEMIEHAQKDIPNLFLLDEIFKGTNTIERIAAGKAVLKQLCKKQNIVLVSTHDIELTNMLQEDYDLYHFSEIVNDKNVDFDYKLKKGKLTNRNAIRILEINNYPKEIIDEAITTAKEMDITKRS